MTKTTKIDRPLIFERDRASKDRFNIECAVATTEGKVFNQDENGKLLELMKDENFIEACHCGDSKKFIFSLVEAGVLQLEDSSKANIRAGWYSETANILTNYQAAFEANAVVAYDFAAGVGVAVVVVYIGEATPLTKDMTGGLLKSETNRKCVAIAGQLGGVQFKKTMLDIFQRLESGEKVVLR
ncbi:MAG: hypothetical protein LKF36_09005 [Lactobacillus sp.]|jgi:hypothetical protein|nr:hypothetical protein [Lactobacillus sp.]